MEDFSGYRKLNIKKVIIAVAILALLIVSIIVFVASRKMENQPKENNNTQAVENNVESKTQIFKDVDGKVSIELPTKYNLVQAHNSEYLIKVSSPENMSIYVSYMEKMEGRPLASVARADKLAYIESYNANSNVSDIKELNVNGNLAETYSFHYLDENLNKAFCLQIVLLELDDGIYIFDIDYPLDDLSLYKNLVTEVLENFIKY